MREGVQQVLFVFTFKQAGIYVFALNNDSTKLAIFRVMEDGQLCREESLLPQLRSAESLASISARLSSVADVNSWVNFLAVVVAVAVVVALVLFALWLYKNHKLDGTETHFAQRESKRIGLSLSTHKK